MFDLQEEKKEVPSSSTPKVDEDDGIDTNVVTFDQDVDYSDSGRLTRGSSSEMPSVYNTANASPARSFSSGGRSPDTVYLSGSEDLPSYRASPARVVEKPAALKAGQSSPEPVGATQRQVYNPNNEDDKFSAREASTASSSGPSTGGLRKRHSMAVSSSTTPFEARSLSTSSSFPAPRPQVEEKPQAQSLSQATPVAKSEPRAAEGLSIAAPVEKSEPRAVEGSSIAAPVEKSQPRGIEGLSIASSPVAIDELSKSSTPSKAETSPKEVDNWEMVSPVSKSRDLGPEWVSVGKLSASDTSPEVSPVQGEALIFLAYSVSYSEHYDNLLNSPNGHLRDSFVSYVGAFID